MSVRGWGIGGMLLGVLLSACDRMSARIDTRPLAIVDVTVIEVETGGFREGMSILIRADTIAALGPSAEVRVPDDAIRVDGRGRWLIPGLWDMHTHAHRRGRAAWHYPRYIAHGVTGIRDMGTDLDSALAHRAAWTASDIAPTVWWGSPVMDGSPRTLPFGAEVHGPEEAQAIAQRYHALGFRFLKVYDRLDRESYRALAEEARRLGIPLEGHVPLKLSPSEVTDAGQRTIEHLTLVLEECIPGTLSWVAADTTGDSMGLLSDGRLAASLERFDTTAANALFAKLALAGVWQVPTLVQMRGAFFVGDSAFIHDPRVSSLPAAVRAEWDDYRKAVSDAVLKAGTTVFRRQLALVGEMHRAGVRMLVGTDASSEPYVFPGSSLHDELALFVEAGLSPLDALRSATMQPARYRGEDGPLIAPGRVADLVLLNGDPTEDIAHTRDIFGVVLRGMYLDLDALDRLREN